MEDFNTNEMLIQYYNHCPPAFLHDRAIEIYKKCISFKVKLTKKVLSILKEHPKNPEWCYYYVNYCIDENIVKTFIKEYQRSKNEIHLLWNQMYYLKGDFFNNSGYDRTSWESYIKYPKSLKQKADEVEKMHETILSFLNAGKVLLDKHDNIISLEYKSAAKEMSLYERELEILEQYEGSYQNDEEYCYVYTLECELFVFYVGIAADPSERYEQHIRGAFSDEAHLFKSKFIQKYHHELKQNIVFEGTRRECKMFEKNYIAEHNPLGNMTLGGEG